MLLTGNKARLQIGKEDIYGTIDDTTVEYAFLSESLKESRDKKTEGVIVGAKGEPVNITIKIGVEGSFSALARPDDIGYILAGVLGVEDTVNTVGTNGYKHTFKAIETTEGNSLPSFTIKIDRIADVFGYAGSKINELKISSSSGDFVKIDVNIIGKSESTSQSLATLSKSSLKPFLFSGGTIKFGSTEIEITNIDLTYKNNLKNDIQTNKTGLYIYEPQPAERQINISCETLFNDESLAQYTAYYKTDSSFALELSFISTEEIETGLAYSMKISIPAAQIINNEFGVKGKDTLKHSFELKAIDLISSELITIELINKRSTKYI